jgi:hypothetical protein
VDNGSVFVVICVFYECTLKHLNTEKISVQVLLVYIHDIPYLCLFCPKWPRLQDYINLARRFLKGGASLHGLGIQGHVKDFIKPDPTMIWVRYFL